MLVQPAGLQGIDLNQVHDAIDIKGRDQLAGLVSAHDAHQQRIEPVHRHGTHHTAPQAVGLIGMALNHLMEGAFPLLQLEEELGGQIRIAHPHHGEHHLVEIAAPL